MPIGSMGQNLFDEMETTYHQALLSQRALPDTVYVCVEVTFDWARTASPHDWYTDVPTEAGQLTVDTPRGGSRVLCSITLHGVQYCPHVHGILYFFAQKKHVKHVKLVKKKEACKANLHSGNSLDILFILTYTILHEKKFATQAALALKTQAEHILLMTCVLFPVCPGHRPCNTIQSTKQGKKERNNITNHTCGHNTKTSVPHS